MMAGMPPSRKVPLLLAAVIFTLVIATVIVAYGYTRRTARNAEAALADMQRLHVNVSLMDVQSFVDSHAATASSKEVTCTERRDGTCELVIRFDNRWLAKLHLAPPTNFAAGFTSSRGRVVRIEASIAVHRQIPGTFRNIYAAEATEQLFDPELGREPFYRVHKLANAESGKFIPLFLDQRLDERATPDQRKLAYSSLNLSCLYILGGCKDAEALAPSGWTAADKAGWRDETTTEQSH